MKSAIAILKLPSVFEPREICRQREWTIRLPSSGNYTVFKKLRNSVVPIASETFLLVNTTFLLANVQETRTFDSLALIRFLRVRGKLLRFRGFIIYPYASVSSDMAKSKLESRQSLQKTGMQHRRGKTLIKVNLQLQIFCKSVTFLSY